MCVWCSGVRAWCSGMFIWCPGVCAESSPSLPIPLLLFPNEDQQRTLQLTELLNTLSCQEKMVL